jgi:branched-subunit amino acid ABC-type transport system permease component
VAQLIFDSLIRSSELALLAVGLTMVYSVLRFPNFSHVEFAPLGAYLALAGATLAGLPLALAGLIAVVFCGVAGVAADRLVFQHLRERSPIMLMIAAFALGIAMRETLRAIFGPSPQNFPLPLQAPLDFLGASVTPVQLVIIAAALVCMLLFHGLLTYTKLGVAMRAAADNANLAQASGIYTERVIRAVWLIGSAFAGLGGILLGLDTQIYPMMGFSVIVPVFCAAILGGIGSPYGAMLGALVLGFAENFGLSINFAFLGGLVGLETEYLFIPTGYKPAIAFVFLILVLLLRPQGIMGARSR